MKALMLKNWLTLRKGNSLFLVFIVVYAIAGAFLDQAFYAWFVALFCALMPKSVMAFDERSGWQRCSAALPLPRRMQVESIYLMSMICVVLGTLVLCGGRTLVSLATARPFVEMSIPATTALMLSTGLLLCALNYPFIFRFGVEKGRSATMMASVGIAVFLFLVGNSMDLSLLPRMTLPLLLVLSLLAWLGSMMLSIRWFEARDL